MVKPLQLAPFRARERAKAPPMHHRLRIAAGLCLALCPFALNHAALAGGFEVGENGSFAVSRGAAFTVRADDLTAISHNPAGLIHLRGTSIQLSHNTVGAHLQFTRSPTLLAHDPNPAGTDPTAPVQNQSPWFALGGMGIVASDLGTKDFVFALGMYGPSASGSQSWAKDGGQRYMLTSMDVLMVYYSAAIAWGKRDHYSLGLTLQLAHELTTKLSLMVDGTTGGAIAPYYSPTDVESTIHLSAKPAPTAIAGGWYRLNDNWELGASGRVMPAYMHGTGNITLANSARSGFTAKQLEVKDNTAALNLIIPPTAKVGVRYRGMDGATERWDLELNFVYEAWSMMTAYDLNLTGKIQLFASADAPNVIIARNWKDTLAVRLGGTYNLPNLPLSLSAGAYGETGAVPQNYEYIDFPSYNRLGLSGGVQGHFGVVEGSLGYMHVFQEDRTTSELTAKIYQQRPVAPCPAQCTSADGKVQYAGAPSNSGTYQTSFDIISVSAQYKF